MESGLEIAPHDATDGSRFGGFPPVFFQDHLILRTHDYLLTLGAGSAEWLVDSEASVFLRRGYGIGDPDGQYPDIALRVVLHPTSPRGSEGGHPDLTSRALVPSDTSPETPPTIRIADEPRRVQEEPAFLTPVLTAGYRFLFTFDEDGLPVDDVVVSQYLFGYGAAHFFGRLDPQGQAEEIVAGLIENS